MARLRSALVLALYGLVPPLVAFAQATPDHLICSKVRDSGARGRFQVTLTTVAGAQSCIVKTPAKLACVEAAKTAVSPTPPGGGPGGSAAGAFLCYRAKCPRPAANSTNAQDQFGQRTISIRTAQLFCAPATIAAPPPGVTTTTLPGVQGACEFRNDQCQGSCGPGARCRASAGAGACECFSVSCGDADRPQCDGACSDPGEACIFTVTGCSCASIP